jgi:hypothetical protein
VEESSVSRRFEPERRNDVHIATASCGFTNQPVRLWPRIVVIIIKGWIVWESILSVRVKWFFEIFYKGKKLPETFWSLKIKHYKNTGKQNTGTK